MLRWFRFILICFAMLLSCSSKDQKEGGGVTLTFWQFWTDPQVKPVLLNLIHKFEEQNPGIKVEVTDLTWSNGHEKIVVAFGSNSAPDVLELGSDWVSEFAYQGVLFDMTSEVDSLWKFYRMWEPATKDKRIYGFPWLLDTRVLFFNKDLMKKAGLNPTQPPGTWQELLQAAQKIHNPKNQIYGFGANSAEKHRLYKKFLPFFWGNNALILSPDAKECWINSKQGREALEFYVNLCKYGLIDTQLRLDEAFTEGKIGFVISGGWLLQQIKKNRPELSFEVALMPRPSQVSGFPASFAGGEFLSINQKSQHIREAMKLVRFLTSLDNALELCKAIGSASPSDAMAPLDPYYQEDPYLKVFQEQLNFARTPPVMPEWVYIEEQIEKSVEQAMYRKLTPTQALDKAKQSIDKLLQKHAQEESDKKGVTPGKIQPQEAEKIIARRAKEAITTIKNKDLVKLSSLVHPVRGVRFSPYSFVRILNDLVFRPDRITQLMSDTTKFKWGEYDSSRESILLSFAQYYQKYIYDADYANSKEISYNRFLGRSNTKNNIPEIYPGCITVEYYFPALEDKSGGRYWKSLWLVFEEKEGIWYLVGTVHDQGTIR